MCGKKSHYFHGAEKVCNLVKPKKYTRAVQNEGNIPIFEKRWNHGWDFPNVHKASGTEMFAWGGGHQWKAREPVDCTRSWAKPLINGTSLVSQGHGKQLFRTSWKKNKNMQQLHISSKRVSSLCTCTLTQTPWSRSKEIIWSADTFVHGQPSLFIPW